MPWQMSPSVFAELAASGILLVLAIYFPWRDPTRRARLIGVTLIFDCSLWILSHALEIGIPLVSYKEALVGIQLVLGIIAMSLWLIYIFHYLGPRKSISWRIYILFGIIPLIAVLALSYNNINGLMWTGAGLDSQNPYLPLQPTYGAIYWACMIYVSMLTLTGSFLIIWNVLRYHYGYIRESIFLLIAAIIPLIVSLIEVMGLLSTYNISVGITSWAGCIGAVIIVLNLPQFRLDQVIPVARDIIFDQIEDCILVLDKQNRVLDLNPAAEQLTGYGISDAFGLHIEQIWTYQSTPLLPFNKIVNESAEVVLERDGNQRTFALHISTIADPGGRNTSKVVLLSDITERKQSENALRESEAQYRLLADNMRDQIWLMDLNLKPIYVSPSVEKVRGYTFEELTQLPLDKQLAATSFQSAMEFFAIEMPRASADPTYFAHPLELEWYNKDGSTLWTENTFSQVLDKSGKLISLLGVGRDITSRKQVEEALRESEGKYRSVVENAREAIFITVDGMVKFANHRASELSGYSIEEFCSRHFIDFVHPDDHRMMAERYLQWMQKKDVPKTIALRVIFKKGDVRLAELSVVSITWEGEPAILSFLTDITDRRRLEEERQRVEKMESVGLLAGGIAHDFNNIMTAILGNINLARTEATPGSELQNSLEQAEKASQRAKHLTQQLLTFSKGGAPVTKLASLTELLRDTSTFALHGSNVNCRLSIPDDLWHAKIDTGQVSQVIHNLVINAQQAMPNGGSIELIAENMAISETGSIGRGLPLKEGNYVRVTVTDHGSGITADQLDKIFDPFFTTKKTGSGLGLATSFSIARQHGGHLSAESEPGSGSRFHFYLPASMETAIPEQHNKEVMKPAGEARILVMDDEQGIREIAGRMLKHLGYKDIEFATDGVEAIKLYKAAMKSGNPFTVAILDLTIAGGMGGKETIKKLLKVDAGVNAIVSSGYADDSAMAEYRGYGFSGMVAKPYTLEELAKALHDAIG